MYRVERATQDQAEAIETLVNKFFDESLKDYYNDYCKAHTLNIIKLLIDNGESFVLLKDNEVVGCVGGSVVDCLFNPQTKEFVELIWYVEESHRRAGLRLFNRLEQACKDKGVKCMRMAYMANSKADKLESFYKKKGYKPMEVHLFKKMEE